jgi:hypothetical protein
MGMVSDSDQAEALREIREDYDWKQAFEFAARPQWCLGDEVKLPADAVTPATVARVIAYEQGENDGDSWIIVGECVDGNHFYLHAGCDYTGWDCQAGGECVVSTSMQRLITFGLDDEARDRLGLHVRVAEAP